MDSKNYYAELAKINVSEHVEKKGRFSYLSWAWAVDQLRRSHPDATWETIRFNGMPFMKTECGYFVEVAVTVNGITLSQIHPVLDNNNKPIAQPNSFQINTSIQRCLVKAIALHGLGLYIYAGEDLPYFDEPNEEPKQVVNSKPIENYIPLDTTDRTPSKPISQKQVGLIKTLALELVDLGISKKDSFTLMQLEVGEFKELTELSSDKASRCITKLNELKAQQGAS